MDAIFADFIHVSYWPYTGHLSFLELQTKDQRIELHSEHFCACYLQVLKKVPCTRSGMFWFSWVNLHDSTTIQ